MSRRAKKDYEVLFMGDATEGPGLGHERVKSYCTKTIRSGNQVECEMFPVWNTRAEAGRARREKANQREAQQRVNERNFRKKIIRRANASFTEKDLFVTLTYRGEVPDEAKAKQDIVKFIRDVRYWRRKRGLPDMQYIYVIEFDDGSGTRKRVHFHLLMTGMDRDALELLWPHGRANARRLQPDEHGFTAVVTYMLKAKKATRRCRCSNNITEPTITTSYQKISLKKVERLAAGLPDVAASVFEKAYPGCKYLDCVIKRSDFVAGAYVYARMRRRK